MNLRRVGLQPTALPSELSTQIKAHFLRSDLNRLPFVLQTNALPIELLVAHAKELLSVPLFYFVSKSLISSNFLTISVTRDTPRGGLLNVSLAGAGFEPAISNFLFSFSCQLMEVIVFLLKSFQ